MKELFSDDDDAMVALGVGKNMVRSIRFWSQVAGILQMTKGAGYSLTELGEIVFGERGDPFLEDIRTLWLIHWNLSTTTDNPLLAWDFLLNSWQEPEIVPSMVLKALKRETEKESDGPSLVTLEQHFDTFLHTYVPTRGRKGVVQEDNLDCPLVELEFIVKIGERELDRSSGKRESIYTFRREEKPDITPELFVYCLADFWRKRHAAELTLTFRQVAHGHGSPGQVFKLPEEDIRARVDALGPQTNGLFNYNETANQQLIQKNGSLNNADLLRAVYTGEAVHV